MRGYLFACRYVFVYKIIIIIIIIRIHVNLLYSTSLFVDTFKTSLLPPTQVCDMADAPSGSLSSYAYILMLLHYLQRTTPPVIPVLQEVRDC